MRLRLSFIALFVFITASVFAQQNQTVKFKMAHQQELEEEDQPTLEEVFQLKHQIDDNVTLANSKQPTTDKQMLDSIVSCNQKQFFEYNYFGDLIFYLSQYKPSVEFINQSKEIHDFDDQNRWILSEYYYWDTYTNTWIGNSKYESEYDDNGNQIMYASYSNWDEINNSWIGSYKYFKEYDNNYLISRIYQYWNNDEFDWQFDTKTEYSNAGNVYTTTYYDWSTYTQTWIPEDKEVETYDDNGQYLAYEGFYWNEDAQDWIPVLKYIDIIYDTYGNMIEYTGYMWDEDAQEWVNAEKLEATANEFGYLIATYYEWDTDLSEWVGYEKEEYGYDVNGNRILYIQYDWDVDLSDWVYYSKSVDEYDANNYRILSEYSYWNSDISDWVYYYKYEYSYNDDGYNTLYSYYTWDTDLQIWIGNYKYEYTFDDNNNLILHLNYAWDYDLNEWYVTGQSENEYNSFGYKTQEIYSYWDSNLEELLPSSKYLYDYDQNNNKVTYEYFYWNNDKAGWVESSFNQYVYDTDIPFSDLVTPEWLTWNNKRISDTISYWEGSYYLPYDTANYYYTDGVFDIKETTKLNVLVFPNPTTSYVSVNSGTSTIENIMIFDLNGKMIETLTSFDAENIAVIDLSSYSEGIYLINVRTNEGSYIQKVIKE